MLKNQTICMSNMFMLMLELLLLDYNYLIRTCLNYNTLDNCLDDIGGQHYSKPNIFCFICNKNKLMTTDIFNTSESKYQSLNKCVNLTDR